MTRLPGVDWAALDLGLRWKPPSSRTAPVPFYVEPLIDAGLLGVVGRLRAPALASDRAPVVLVSRGTVSTVATAPASALAAIVFRLHVASGRKSRAKLPERLQAVREALATVDRALGGDTLPALMTFTADPARLALAYESFTDLPGMLAWCDAMSALDSMSAPVHAGLRAAIGIAEGGFGTSKRPTLALPDPPPSAWAPLIRAFTLGLGFPTFDAPGDLVAAAEMLAGGIARDMAYTAILPPCPCATGGAASLRDWVRQAAGILSRGHDRLPSDLADRTLAWALWHRDATEGPEEALATVARRQPPEEAWTLACSIEAWKMARGDVDPRMREVAAGIARDAGDPALADALAA